MTVDTRPSRRAKAGKGQRSKAWASAADDDFDAAIKERGDGINFAGLWDLVKTVFASKSSRKMILPAIGLLGLAILVLLGLVAALVPTQRLPTRSVFLEIGPSSVAGAGLGLFVSNSSRGKVHEGTILTHYGGKDTKLTEKNRAMVQEYALGNPKRAGYMRVAGPWEGEVPYKVVRDESVGHLINDAGCILLEHITKREKPIAKVVKEYYRLSEGKANVNYRDGVLDLSYEMTAARELLPGEELFMSYGEMYWLHPIMEDPTLDSLNRLALYMYTSSQHPDRFLNGYIYLDHSSGTPRVMSSLSREELDEAYCRNFLTSYVELKDTDTKLMKKLGMKNSMSNKEKLVTMMLAADMS